MQAGTRYSRAGYQKKKIKLREICSIISKKCNNLGLEMYLGMFEEMHDENGKQQSGYVSREAGAEVQVALSFQRLVESEQQGDEYARYDNVAQA